MVERKKIDFLIIGSQRCGTTYLHKVYENDDAIDVPKVKEINYFSKHIYHKNIEWYLNLFKKENKIRGEASPSYFLMRPAEIRHLSRLFPELKIIMVLREPINRMWSAIGRQRSYSYLPDTHTVGKTFTAVFQFVMRPSNLNFGRYDYALKKWEKYFTKSNIYIGFYDDLKNDPNGFMENINSHINHKHFENLPQVIANRTKERIDENEWINYILFQVYKRDLKRMMGRGFNYPKLWYNKYLDRYANMNVPIHVRILGVIAQVLLFAVYDPLNIIFNWYTFFKLKRIR